MSAEDEYQRIKTATLRVIQQWPGLSPVAVWAEVEWSLWPRPKEIDIKAAILRLMAEDGTIEFTSDRRFVVVDAMRRRKPASPPKSK